MGQKDWNDYISELPDLQNPVGLYDFLVELLTVLSELITLNSQPFNLKWFEMALYQASVTKRTLEFIAKTLVEKFHDKNNCNYQVNALAPAILFSEIFFCFGL